MAVLRMAVAHPSSAGSLKMGMAIAKRDHRSAIYLLSWGRSTCFKKLH